jgi:hypothetical protein
MFDAVLSRICRTAPAVADTTAAAVAVTFARTIPDLPGLSDAERAVLSEWLARSLSHLQG